MRSIKTTLFMSLTLAAVVTGLHAGEECATTAAACADAKLQKVAFKVGGLDCEASCGQLDAALTKVAGVTEKSLCTESKTAKVTFDSSKVSKQQLVAAIKAAGYQFNGEQIALKVGGLSCGACSTKVSTALNKVEGVSENSVCHEGKEAVVTFDPEKTSKEKIVEAIGAVGFAVVQEPAAN